MLLSIGLSRLSMKSVIFYLLQPKSKFHPHIFLRTRYLATFWEGGQKINKVLKIFWIEKVIKFDKMQKIKHHMDRLQTIFDDE